MGGGGKGGHHGHHRGGGGHRGGHGHGHHRHGGHHGHGHGHHGHGHGHHHHHHRGFAHGGFHHHRHRAHYARHRLVFGRLRRGGYGGASCGALAYERYWAARRRARRAACAAFVLGVAPPLYDASAGGGGPLLYESRAAYTVRVLTTPVDTAGAGVATGAGADTTGDGLCDQVLAYEAGPDGVQLPATVRQVAGAPGQLLVAVAPHALGALSLDFVVSTVQEWGARELGASIAGRADVVEAHFYVDAASVGPYQGVRVAAAPVMATTPLVQPARAAQQGVYAPWALPAGLDFGGALGAAGYVVALQATSGVITAEQNNCACCTVQ